jgi:predicted phosphodiesterase
MRVAIFSDIHGNIRGLDACLADLKDQGGADVVVAAGDLCMDGPRPREVLERLESIGARCLRGNTDRYIGDVQTFTTTEPGDEDFAQLAWQREAIGPEWTKRLFELPFSLRFGDGGGGEGSDGGGGDGRERSEALLVVHANPKTDDEHIWPDAGDALLARFMQGVEENTIAFGHLHLPYVRRWREKLLVNVSSAGLPKDGDARANYALLTQRSGGWEVKHRRVAFDVEKTARDIMKSGMPEPKARIKVLRRHRYKELDERIP